MAEAEGEQPSSPSNQPQVQPKATLSLTTSSAAAGTTPSVPKKELPYLLKDVELDILVILLADVLTKIIAHNDQIPVDKANLTRFHSKSPPSISVLAYLQRIVKYAAVERGPLLATLNYIDIFAKKINGFTLSSLTVHRFLIAATTVAVKAYSDVFCTNGLYAKVGGIPVTELNTLERHLLRGLNWDLNCRPSLLHRYYSSIIVSHGGFTQAPAPSATPVSHTPKYCFLADSDMAYASSTSASSVTASSYSRSLAWSQSLPSSPQSSLSSPASHAPVDDPGNCGVDYENEDWSRS